MFRNLIKKFLNFTLQINFSVCYKFEVDRFSYQLWSIKAESETNTILSYLGVSCQPISIFRYRHFLCRFDTGVRDFRYFPS
jgi:hypothetical protein